MAKAIDDFHRKTCIKFVPRTQQTDYVNIFPDQGCYALVGRQGGRQPLSLADGNRSRKSTVFAFLLLQVFCF